jgi:hypothetical protein
MKQAGLGPEEKLGHFSVEGDTEAILVFRTIGLLGISPSKNATEFTVDRLLQSNLRWDDISRVIGRNLFKRAMLRLLVGRYERKYGFKEDGDNRWLYLNNESSPLVLDHGHCEYQNFKLLGLLRLVVTWILSFSFFVLCFLLLLVDLLLIPAIDLVTGHVFSMEAKQYAVVSFFGVAFLWCVGQCE